MKMADTLMLSFDALDRKTFNDMRLWFEKAVDASQENVGKILVAKNMKAEGASVTRQEAKALAREFKSKYIEMS